MFVLTTLTTTSTMLPKFLTAAYPLEEHFYLVPRFALCLIGFYPETRITRHLQIWACFNFCLLTCGNYAELYFGIYNLTIDVASALDALCPVASSIMSMVKIFCLWRYRSEFKYLIERVRSLTTAESTLEKIRVKSWYLTLATQLTALVLFFGIVTCTTYAIRAIFNILLHYLAENEISFQMPFKMMFPDVLVRMPMFPLTFVLTSWHGYTTVLAFVGCDGLFLSFCFYFTVLLKGLAFDLKNCLVTFSAKSRLEPHNQEKNICLKLAEIIERHNEISALTELFSKVMSIITLGHFVTSSLIICMSVADLLIFPGYGRITYVVYTCAAFTQICLYCLGGSALTESSLEVANAAYCSDWCEHSVKVQKMVLLIVTRAQRGLIVKVPFFVPSLPALAAIIRFTGSLLALAQSLL